MILVYQQLHTAVTSKYIITSQMSTEQLNTHARLWFYQALHGKLVIVAGNCIVNNKLWLLNASVVMETSTAEVMVADRM